MQEPTLAAFDQLALQRQTAVDAHHRQEPRVPYAVDEEPVLPKPQPRIVVPPSPSFPKVQLDAVDDAARQALEEVEREHGRMIAVAYRFSLIIAARGGVPYRGTVPHHVKAKRRAKDKVARESRRVNRGGTR